MNLFRNWDAWKKALKNHSFILSYVCSTDGMMSPVDMDMEIWNAPSLAQTDEVYLLAKEVLDELDL